MELRWLSWGQQSWTWLGHQWTMIVTDYTPRAFIWPLWRCRQVVLFGKHPVTQCTAWCRALQPAGETMSCLWSLAALTLQWAWHTTCQMAACKAEAWAEVYLVPRWRSHLSKSNGTLVNMWRAYICDISGRRRHSTTALTFISWQHPQVTAAAADSDIHHSHRRLSP